MLLVVVNSDLVVFSEKLNIPHGSVSLSFLCIVSTVLYLTVFRNINHILILNQQIHLTMFGVFQEFPILCQTCLGDNPYIRMVSKLKPIPF